MVMNRVHNIFNVDIFKEVYKDDLSCMNRYYVLLCKNMSWWYLEISHVNLKLKSLSLSHRFLFFVLKPSSGSNTIVSLIYKCSM
jgi:hypothetical protein